MHFFDSWLWILYECWHIPVCKVRETSECSTGSALLLETGFLYLGIPAAAVREALPSLLVCVCVCVMLTCLPVGELSHF